MNFLESNYAKLYKSSVEAFPATKARQHLIETILVKNIKYVPFVGMKTIYITSEAHSSGKIYKPMILIKNVVFNQNARIAVRDEINHIYYIENVKNNDVKIRCSCKDMKFRWGYYDYLDHSLYSKMWPKYIANGKGEPANSKEMPGMCKHLMALFNQIDFMH